MTQCCDFFYLQETKNPDTIKLRLRIQRQYLKDVAKYKGNAPGFLRLLAILEDTDVAVEVREDAEKRVKEAANEFGAWIGHGDLLTVKMVQEAKMLMKGSATAFGRLQFLGPFRLQLLHMEMKKIAQDYSSGMPSVINFDDALTLSWQASMARIKVANKAKDIKKNDSTFELHDQFAAGVQACYLANMFDNFSVEHPTKLDSVDSCQGVIDYIKEMLSFYDIQL